MALAPARSEVLKLFPTVVQFTELTDAESINRTLSAAVDEQLRTVPNSKPDAWACTVYTTIASGSNLLELAPFDLLAPFVIAQVGEYLDVLGLEGAGSVRITESWLNVYGRGDSQEPHQHANSVVSGIYYVETPPQAATLTIHSPMADTMLDPPRRAPGPLNSMAATLPVLPGQLLLFRSYLRHSVRPNPVDGRRVSIAFNAQL